VFLSFFIPPALDIHIALNFSRDFFVLPRREYIVAVRDRANTYRERKRVSVALLIRVRADDADGELLRRRKSTRREREAQGCSFFDEC
jgi:hypothetical protein